MKNLCYYDVENFGDALSKTIFSKIVFGDIKTSSEPFDCEYHIFIGSLIHPKYVNRNCIVSGGGFISENIQLIEYPKKIVSVRGKYSQKKLREYDINLMGDPGLITSEIFKKKHSNEYKFGIIPHYVDYDLLRKNLFNDNVLLINPSTKNPEQVIDSILMCEKIISSSLHGLVVSHSYGIPSLWCEFSNKVIGNGFKFFDYFSSVGIDNYRLKFDDKLIKKMNNLNYLEVLFNENTKRTLPINFNIKNYYEQLINELNK